MLDNSVEFLGFLAIALTLVGHSWKSPRVSLLMLCLPALLWASYFYALAAYLASAVAILALLRNFLGAKLSDKKMRYSTGMMALVGLCVLSFMYHNPSDVLPIIAFSASSFSVFNRNNPLSYRLCCLLAQSSMLFYGVLIVSAPLILSSLAIIISICVSIQRFDLQRTGGVF